MEKDIKKEGTTTLSKEEVIDKIKKVASKYPKGQKFYLDEVYDLIGIDKCGSRKEFIDFLFDNFNEIKGLAISIRGQRYASEDKYNVTHLFLE